MRPPQSSCVDLRRSQDAGGQRPSSKQIKRLANNTYQASRGVMEILGELLSAARNKPAEAEPCLVNDLVLTTWQDPKPRAEVEGVRFQSTIPPDL